MRPRPRHERAADDPHDHDGVRDLGRDDAVFGVDDGGRNEAGEERGVIEEDRERPCRGDAAACPEEARTSLPADRSD